MKCTFNQFVLSKMHPKMMCSPTPSGDAIHLVPVERIVRGLPIPFQYTLVNRDMNVQKTSFASEDEAIDAIFDATHIMYWPDLYPNELFNKKYEMMIEFDMTNNEVSDRNVEIHIVN